jgi:hypothetical protein
VEEDVLESASEMDLSGVEEVGVVLDRIRRNKTGASIN